MRAAFCCRFALAWILALFLGLAGGKVAAAAEPGELDSSFDVDGIVEIDIPGFGDDIANAMAIDDDGKIILAGTNGDFVAVRLNTNGSRDTSFSPPGNPNPAGIVTIDVPGLGDDIAYAMAIDDDGKIILAGTNGDFVAMRLNADGSLDTSFNPGGIEPGIATIDIPGTGVDIAHAVTIDDLGRIVLAGTNGNFVAIRLSQNGDLDTGFGDNGYANIDIPGAGEDIAHAVAIDAGGRIILAGTNGDFALMRLDPDGDLDTSFNPPDAIEPGKVTINVPGTGDDIAHAVAIDDLGRIVLAGGNGDFVAMRLNADGSRDTSFNLDGIATIDIPGTGTDFANGLAIDADGKLVLAGTNGDFVVVRLNEDGTPDTDFDVDGIVTTDIPGTGNDTAYAVALQNDGKIVAAGTNGNFVAARYRASSGFCGDGEVTGSEECDGGLCCSASCTLEPNGTVCRAGDVCDREEQCDGSSPLCPEDLFEPATTVCRPGSGDVCNPDEFCTGDDPVCPEDDFEPATTICRPGSGDLCDPDEFCLGNGGGCEPEEFEPATTVCDAGTGDLCDPAALCLGKAKAPCHTDSDSFDDFDRSEGPIGNGWIDCPGNSHGQLEISTGYDAIDDGEATTAGDGGGLQCIYRPTSLSNPLSSPVRIRATITETDSSSGGGSRFESSLTLFYDGTETSHSRGYGILVARSGGDSNDSLVRLLDNGRIQGVDDEVSSFDFDSELDVDFTIFPDGSIQGTISEGTNVFPFSSGARTIDSNGTHFAAALNVPAEGSLLASRMDNVSIAQDVVAAANTVCNPGSGDICDLDEVCSGTPDKACPEDDVTDNAGLLCYAGSGGICDQDQFCSGIEDAMCPNPNICSSVVLRLVDQSGAEIPGSRITVNGQTYPTGTSIDLPPGFHVFGLAPGLFGVNQGATTHLSRQVTQEVAPGDPDVPLLWETATGPVRLRDQDDQDIPGSRLIFLPGTGNISRDTGTVITLPVTTYPDAIGTQASGYKIDLLPGLLGVNQGSTVHLQRQATLDVAPGDMQFPLDWDTATGLVLLRDQHDQEIPGSRLIFLPGFGNISRDTGTVITLPVTTYPDAIGTQAGGYQIDLSPGLLGVNQGGTTHLKGRGLLGVALGDAQFPLQWIQTECDVHVLDSNGQPVPGSTLIPPAPFSPLTQGDSVVFPVTENPAYEPMVGTLAGGYLIDITPGDIAPTHDAVSLEMLTTGEFSPSSFMIGGNSYSLVCADPTQSVVLRLVDGSGAEIPGSQITVGQQTVATGSSMGLTAGVHTAILRPGLFGASQPEGISVLIRQKNFTVDAQTTQETFEWITVTRTVRLHDQDDVDIPGSQLQFMPGVADVLIDTGTVVTFPITDNDVYPTVGGNAGTGYNIELFPGFFGDNQDPGQGLLHRRRIVEVTDAPETPEFMEMALEWIEIDCPLQVFDAADQPVPGSSLTLPAPFPAVTPGETVPFLVTQETGIVGSFGDGYDISVTPGDIAPTSDSFLFEMSPSGTFDPPSVQIGGNSYKLVCEPPLITIDATALSPQQIEVIDVASGPNSSLLVLDLAPGLYRFRTNTENSFFFNIDAEGLVDYDTSLSGFLEGQGTTLLKVKGFDVAINATALSPQETWINAFDYDAPFPQDTQANFTWIPGNYRFATDSGNSFVFELKNSGGFEYSTDFNEFLGGRGENTLMVLGHEVTIDARELDPLVASITARDYDAPVSTTQLTSFIWIPGDYRFGVGAESFAFTLENAGAVQDLPATFLGFPVSENGTATILFGPMQNVLCDGSILDNPDNLIVNGGFEDGVVGNGGIGAVPVPWVSVTLDPDTWDSSGNNGMDPEASPWFAGVVGCEGTRWVGMSRYPPPSSGQPEAMGQQLQTPLTPNATYRISAVLHDSQPGGPPLTSDGPYHSPGGYKVYLSETGSLSGPQAPIELGELAPVFSPEDGWVTREFLFPVPANDFAQHWIIFETTRTDENELEHVGLDRIELVLVSPGDVCGDGNVTGTEECDGGTCCSSSCSFEPTGTPCGTEANECGEVAACTGDAAECPADPPPTGGPPVEVQKLFPDDGAEVDNFGNSVAVDGDTILVGVHSAAHNGPASGAAYVFVRDEAGEWTWQDTLHPFGGTDYDRFGRSVALDGDTALVGAPSTPLLGSQTEAAYVFVRDEAGEWTQQQKLEPPDIDPDGGFGNFVSLEGDTALISGTNNGLTSRDPYVFVREDGSWGEPTRLTALGGEPVAQFGRQSSLYGDTAVVLTGGHEITGSAYVFVREGTVWTEQDRFSHPEDGGWFRSVSLKGDTLLLGAGEGFNTGSAYVFVREGVEWSQQAELQALEQEDGDNFGGPVSLEGDIALVGAHTEHNENGSFAGAVYVFERIGTTWLERDKLLAFDETGINFGSSVSISNGTIVVGESSGFNDEGIQSGAAYVFELAASCTAACDGSVLDNPDNLIANPGFEEGPGTINFDPPPDDWDAVALHPDLWANDGVNGPDPNAFPWFPGVTACEGSRWVALGGLPDEREESMAQMLATPLNLNASYQLSAVLHLSQPGTAAEGGPFHSPGGYAIYLSADGTLDNPEFVGELPPVQSPDEGWVVRELSFVADAAKIDKPWIIFEAKREDAPPEMEYVGIDRIELVLVSDPGDDCGDGQVTGVEECDGGSCCNSTSCTFEPVDTVCRGPVDVCDIEEVCQGDSASCPEDEVVLAGTVCNAGSGDLCDPDDVCSGEVGVGCLEMLPEPSSTVCRAAVDLCDEAETCPGTAGDECPDDGFKSAGTVCRAATDQCDAAEECSGASVLCPDDEPVTNGTPCDDSNGCTLDDACLIGACLGNPILLDVTKLCQVQLASGPAGPPAPACEIAAATPVPHCRGEVEELTLLYTGGGCVLSNAQGGNASCQGDDPGLGPVAIATDPEFLATPDQDVFAGEVVTLSHSSGQLPALTGLDVTGTGGTQTLEFETSCSQPLNLGDQFGSWQVAGLQTTQGGSVQLGAWVDYSYGVGNPNSDGIENVSVTDDVLGPIDAGFDIPALGGVQIVASQYVTADVTNIATVTADHAGQQCVEETAEATVTIVPSGPVPLVSLAPQAGHRFGSAVAVVNHQVAVGAPAFVNASIPGAAYLFEATDGSWVRNFDSPNSAGGDKFGASLAALGDRVLVGAPRESTLFVHGGAAYLFDTSSDPPFVFPDPSVASHIFGFSVAAGGDNLLMGANANNTLFAHRFDANALSEDPLDSFPNPSSSSPVGTSVAAVGNDILVGSPNDTAIGSVAGAAYLFDGPSGDLKRTFLPPEEPFAGSAFGTAVAAAGGDVLIGAPQHNTVEGITQVGAVYLMDSATGNPIRTIENPITARGALFGASLSVSGNTVLIGAPGFGDGDSKVGAAYLFEISTGNLLRTFDNPTPEFSDAFGTSVSISNGIVAIGAPFDDTMAPDAGAAYVFFVPAQPECTDGLDNDGDGLADDEDPGCDSSSDTSERSSLLLCDDGIDNDGDGRTDFDPETFANPGDANTLPSGQGDPGCKNPQWFGENPACQNGIDEEDDPDTVADYDGGYSVTGIPGQPVDPECADEPWRLVETVQQCGLGFELTLLLAPLLWLRRRRGGFPG